jgi:GSCFA family protein
MIRKNISKLVYFCRRRAQSDFSSDSILNNEWRHALRGRKISVKKQKILNENSKIFAIGSCFAVEIRNALRALDYDVYPKYDLIEFDPNRQKIGSLPVRDNVNHYDTFLIRQEIERAINSSNYDDDGFWELNKHRMNEKFNVSSIFQDPYRRNVYAVDKPSLISSSRAIDKYIDEGIEKADIIIITLGLIEVWKHKKTNLYVCMGPSNKQDEINNYVEPYLSNFKDNYENLSSIIDTIIEKYPMKKIILTVSPVALNKTFTDEDIVVANMLSKSTLRTVAGEIVNNYQNVFYWPSYEFAMYEDIFREDGRHVKPANVERIIQSFIQNYS